MRLFVFVQLLALQECLIAGSCFVGLVFMSLSICVLLALHDRARFASSKFAFIAFVCVSTCPFLF